MTEYSLLVLYRYVSMSEGGVEWISFLFESEYTVLYDGGDNILS